PNGAGKTTTIKMLAGLMKPTEGEILYKGRNIRRNLYEFKKIIGYVPESSAVYFHLSAVDYLLLVGRLRCMPEGILYEKIIELMKLFGLEDAMDSEISSYSKGMTQKVLLASALLHNPEILLLDEPLSGLDVTTGLIVKDLVRLLAKKGRIIIYSSHILEVVEKICSRAVIIHKGRIVADDSVDNLRRLMKLPSLEEIFGQLVVQEDTEAVARGIVDVVTSLA
ncbi:MAG: ABC transporter ATP-binding protein, partial [Candidatus Aminicenantes bacterium]|nr:ABC transporter ATP-binding protein [Candidatus Aminicenantes bacterium]